MKHRRTLGLETKKPLPPEKRDLQKQMATCRMVLRFHDNNTWSKWSNEYAQPRKFLNINDSINEMFRICEQYFKGRIASGAIFDVRESKEIGAHNKIYQFEKGFWKMQKPITW